MRRTLAIECAGVAADVDVEARGSARIRALAELTGESSGDTMWIDGRPHPIDTAFHAVAPSNGASVAFAPRPRRAGRGPAVLSVVGGLDAGERWALHAGPHLIGRDPTCDVVLCDRTVSRRHAVVTVRSDGTVDVQDLRSTSDALVESSRRTESRRVTAGAIVMAAATLLMVHTAEPAEQLVLGPVDADGRRAVRRPPRPAVGEPSPLVPPSADLAVGDGPRFSWAAALVPLAGGLVLARLVDPRLALFSLLGPLVIVGQWIEERRRHTRGRSQASGQEARELRTFAEEIARAERAEVARRRVLTPDPAGLADHIEARSTILWRRRTGDADFGLVAVGTAHELGWSVPLDRPAEGRAQAIVERSKLPDAPITIDLEPGTHIGIAGSRNACCAVARWIVLQLVAHHGPSDLRLAVVADESSADEWSWIAMLPHCRAPGAPGSRLVGAGPTAAARVAQLTRLLPADTQLVLLDDSAALVDGDRAPGRSLLDVAGVASLSLAASTRALPSRCDTVVELVGADGWMRVTTSDPSMPDAVAVATGVSDGRARSLARSLAGLADPDEVDAAAVLPETVRLLDLLGLGRAREGELAEVIELTWSGVPSTRAVIGVAAGPEGPTPFGVDLVADGPHGFVAGTTGAGKSELLRTLVLSLATAAPPDRISFVLIDYKGGAAFGECRALPHVVGFVTDLDHGTADRALRSLEAELRRRERALAAAGLRDLAEHADHVAASAQGSVDPLPRLVIVVDELAALVAELPHLVDGLVGIAARGRSLGIHLVLGTQRPAGVVSPAIRTNCSLRACLRVPDDADAIDVVGLVDAARLDRGRPGRAYLRRGASDVLEVQIALVSGGPPVVDDALVARPLRLVPDPWDEPRRPLPSADLGLLVRACCAAWARRGGSPAPRPWLDPLPADLSASLSPDRSLLHLGLVDEPDAQRRLPLSWAWEEGPLIAIGSGRGPTLVLEAAVLAAAATHGPTELHVHCIDLAAHTVTTVHGLDHVGAVVGPGESERLHRLLRLLHDELALRRTAREVRPRVLVVINGVSGLRAALGGLDGLLALDAIERLVVDGPRAGIAVAIAADRPSVVPAAWTSAAALRLACRLGDPVDLVTLGLPALDQGGWPVGRCVDVASGHVAQVATSGWSPRRLAPGSAPTAARVDVLGDDVRLDELAGRAGWDGTSVVVPLGRGADDLGPVFVRLSAARGLLIVGTPGSGRSTTLRSVGSAAAAAGCPVFDAGAGLGDAPDTTCMVLVDDAETIDHAAFTGAIVVAATTGSKLRSDHAHWTSLMRGGAAILLLRPRRDADGDVVGLPLLPRSLVPLDMPGRGLLIDDAPPVALQVARCAP